VKYWKVIAGSAKPVGVGAASQPWILAGEQSSLLTRIVTTEKRFDKLSLNHPAISPIPLPSLRLFTV